MNIISLIQPQELGPDFYLDQGVWHVNFPTTATPPPPISNDARNIIQNVADEMFVDQRDRLTYAMVQDNQTQKIQLWQFPADIEFNINTAIMVSEIDMLGIRGQFDDIAVDGGVVTFTDAQTGLTLTLNTNELQHVGSIKSTNTVIVTETAGVLKLSAKIDSKANNLLEVTADGLQVSPDKIQDIFNAEMATRDVHTQSILPAEEIGLKHVIGDQIINIPKVMLVNSAGGGIALVNDPNSIEQSRFNTNTYTLRISVPKNTTSNINTASLDLPVGSEITVDWGDGSPVETFINGSNFSPQHEYPALTNCVATFTLKGKIPRLYLSGDAIVEVIDFGNAPIDKLRFQCSKLVKVPAVLPVWVTDMTSFFSNCESFNDPSVINWDTSNVTNMSGMFYNCTSFNQPLNTWNVSKVTNMGGMFSGCTNFNQNIDNWDTTNVTSMTYMFNGCKVFNQPLNNWNTSKVTNMSNMFISCTNFNQNIGNWNVSKVANMSDMFYNCTSFNQDLSQWCVTLITSKPTNFNTNAPLLTAAKLPVWGTCPAG